MDDKIKRGRVLSSLLWKLTERGGIMGIQFVVQIILARLLLPEDYGVIALVITFTLIAGVFVQSGLNTALIQKKEVDETDFSSVFYLSLFLAGLIYIILFCAAPFIASFYGEPRITPILRVLSVTLVFGAFNSIQNAVIARELQFKKLFFSSVGAISVSGVIGIYMAYMGYGVWALVWQNMSNQLLITLVLWFTMEWRPRLLFSLSKVRELFSFGWKLLISTLIYTIYGDLCSLIIGKIYTPEVLGFYNRGQQFPALMVANIDGSIQSVMFPVMASEQDDRFRVKNMVRRTIVTSSFVVFPTMVGLAVIAEPLVKLLLTDKWLPCVPFLQIFCATYALMPIHTANSQAINALGRSDIFLKLEIILKIIGLFILIVAAFYGIYAIALGGVVTGIIGSLINAYPNKQLLNYSYKEQWNDIIPSLLLSLMMGIVICSFGYLKLSALVTLIIQVCIGFIFYMGMAWIFKLECFGYLFMTIRELFVAKKAAKG